MREGIKWNYWHDYSTVIGNETLFSPVSVETYMESTLMTKRIFLLM